MKQKIISIFHIFFPLLLGGLVGIIISRNIDYKNLNQPLLSPPSILFPIIWTILYLLMGITYYLIEKENKLSTNEKILYYIQLFVNILWPILFFTLKLRGFSIIWISILDILVLLLFKNIYKKDKKISYLLIPYIIWTFFATYLNIGVYLLN